MPEAPDIARLKRKVNVDEIDYVEFDLTAEGAQAMERWPLLKSLHEAGQDAPDGQAALRMKMAAMAPTDPRLGQPGPSLERPRLERSRPEPAHPEPTRPEPPRIVAPTPETAVAREPLPFPVHASRAPLEPVPDLRPAPGQAPAAPTVSQPVPEVAAAPSVEPATAAAPTRAPGPAGAPLGLLFQRLVAAPAPVPQGPGQDAKQDVKRDVKGLFARLR